MQRLFSQATEIDLIEVADEYTGRQGDGSYPNKEFDSGAIIDCLDFDEPRTITQIKRDAKFFEAQAPLFGPYLAYGGSPVHILTSQM